MTITTGKKKTSIQISDNVHEELKRLCEENGYKLSGFVEKLIRTAVSGSRKQSQQILNG